MAAACCSLAILQPAGAMGQQVVPVPLVAPSVADTQPDGSHLQGLKDYVDTSVEPVAISQLGILARDGHATLDDGEKIAGVTVVDVSSKGAAANALGTHEVPHLLVGGALLGAGVASAVLFPPALIVVALLINSHVGMSYDLVVGVDGSRVRNTLEFMQSMADVQSGDTLYLAIVRGGHRLQIPVQLP
ncbi:MAG TPA: PDZ domain-containing protein [Candidatus Binataceae bacterium]|jgi:S1-C subfamily serine protease|nr:PDZ domain-containing protein [Candidatus Binataceae bacterium]